MDFHIEKLLNEFDESKQTLYKIKDFVLPFLQNELVEKRKMFLVGIEGRVKEEKSLEGKLLLKGQKYKTIKDITDLVGLRVITYYQDEVDIVSAILDKSFDIDIENSVDKRKIYDVDRFGYASVHYICRIPKKLYSEVDDPNINDFRFEIQVRTCLQHVWATIFHDTGYKTDIEIPREYIRKLSRLNGLLEIADDEFLNIKNDINNYRNRIKSLVSQGKFSDISLNIDSYNNYIALNPYKELIQRIATTTHIDIEPGNFSRYYKILVDLDIKYLIDLEQMRKDNSDAAYQLTLLLLAGTDIDIISSTLPLQNIITVYIVRNGTDIDEIRTFIKKLYGENNISDIRVDKLISQVRSVLI